MAGSIDGKWSGSVIDYQGLIPTPYAEFWAEATGLFNPTPENGNGYRLGDRDPMAPDGHMLDAMAP
ncbi:hypothetical protein [Desulfoplanes sp.]